MLGPQLVFPLPVHSKLLPCVHKRRYVHFGLMVWYMYLRAMSRLLCLDVKRWRVLKQSTQNFAESKNHPPLSIHLFPTFSASRPLSSPAPPPCSAPRARKRERWRRGGALHAEHSNWASEISAKWAPLKCGRWVSLLQWNIVLQA